MNQGIEILIARMDSNPEEFVPDVLGNYPSKWRNIMSGIEMRASGGKDYNDQFPFLKDDEIKAVWGKLQSLQGDLFTKKVMNTLLQDTTAELSPFLDNQQARSPSYTITLEET